MYIFMTIDKWELAENNWKHLQHQTTIKMQRISIGNFRQTWWDSKLHFTGKHICRCRQTPVPPFCLCIYVKSCRCKYILEFISAINCRRNVYSRDPVRVFWAGQPSWRHDPKANSTSWLNPLQTPRALKVALSLWNIIQLGGRV